MVRDIVDHGEHVVTDFGPEGKLQTVPADEPNYLFDQWNERDPHRLEVDEPAGATEENESCPMDDDGMEPFQPAPETLSFHRAVRVPGLEHMLHNSEEQVLKGLEGFPKWDRMAKQLGRWLSSKYYMDLFIAKNEQKTGFVSLKAKLSSIRLNYTKRFGSTDGFLEDTLLLERELQLFFDAGDWQHEGGEAEKTDGEEPFVDLDVGQ